MKIRIVKKIKVTNKELPSPLYSVLTRKLNYSWLFLNLCYNLIGKKII